MPTEIETKALEAAAKAIAADTPLGQMHRARDIAKDT